MKRREFFGKTGCGALGMMIAYFGLSSCKKKEEAETAEAVAQAQAPEQEAPMEEMSRKDMVKKMLVEKKGVTEEEADAMIAEFEEMLPMVKEKCICKTCPTYVAEETELGFCHPLVGKSKVITEEKGCNCPQCPIYTEKQMKNGYYCTRNSEMEQEMAKMG
jgi:hypothetical protein